MVFVMYSIVLAGMFFAVAVAALKDTHLAKAAKKDRVGIHSMAARIEVHTGEILARKGATSRVAEVFGKHRTLCVGILYAITIIAVLALVARL